MPEWLEAGVWILAAGALFGAYALFRRVAEIRRKSAAADRRWKAILEAFPDRAMIFDVQATRVDRLLFPGQPQPEPAGGSGSPDAIFPASAIPEVRAAVLKTALTGQDQLLEYALEEGAGTRWFEARTAAIPAGRDGSRNDGVMWVSRDITRSKLSEIECEAVAERHRRLFHAFPDALLVGVVEGDLLFVNERAEALFGLPQDARRRPWTIQDLYAPGSRGLFEGDMVRLKTQNPLLAEREFQKAGGQAFTGDLQAVAIPLRGRLLAGMTVRDLTEERRARNRLEHAACGEARGRFADAVAHDFGDLLTGIAERLDRLAERFPRGSEMGECLAVMRKATDRGLALTRSLPARARSGKISPGKLPAK